MSDQILFSLSNLSLINRKYTNHFPVQLKVIPTDEEHEVYRYPRALVSIDIFCLVSGWHNG